MSDPTPVLQMLGLEDRPEVEPSASDPGAAAAEPTAADPDEGPSLAEALAALDDPAAPNAVAEPETADAAPDAAPDAVALTPEQIAAILAENETFKAEKAQLAAQAEDAQWDTTWDTYIANGERFYTRCAELVQAYGESQDMSPREIRGLISEVVDDGIGIEGINRITTELFVPPGQPGFLDWQRQILNNRVAETRKYLASKNQPSTLDHLAATYALDEADRKALAKFVNYPPDHLEEIARTLGAKNQRLTTNLTAITQQANRNVAANLSQGVAPGVPGASAPKKAYEYTHQPGVKREENLLFARTLGLVRTG